MEEREPGPLLAGAVRHADQQFLAHPAYDNSGEIPTGRSRRPGRTGWNFPLDLHADYTVPFGEQKRLKFVADLFNIFNQRKVTRVDQNFELDSTTPNPDFLKPNTLISNIPT